MNATRGFTILEMLMVIAIITVLAAVAVFATGDVRAKGRDTKRISDLSQLVVAFRVYAEKYDTYAVAGSGSGGNGQGWVSFSGVGYSAAITATLASETILSEGVTDPLVPYGQSEAGDQSNYQAAFIRDSERDGVCVFAQLEKPTPAHIDAFDTAPIESALKTSLSVDYGMNYAACTNQ